MARPIDTALSGDIWHLSIDDLFAPLPETIRLGGPGPFVINLSASSAPIDVPLKGLAGCEHVQLYQLQRIEDRRPRYRLRLGLFTTEDEADEILQRVREIYPGALTATADGEDLRAIANLQPKAAPPPAPPAARPAAIVPPARPAAIVPPVAAPKPVAPIAPAAIAPPVLTAEHHFSWKPPAKPAFASVPTLTIARPAASVPPQAAAKPVAASVPPQAAAKPVAASLPPQAAAKPVAASVPPQAAAKPVAASVPPQAAAKPVAASVPPPAAAKPVPASSPSVMPPARPPVAKTPVSLVPPPREVLELSAPLPRLESTQTVRALTQLELMDEQASRWFVIQLSLSEQGFDPDTVPNLDIFSVYRLYSVAGIDQGRIVHALRLGFFSEEIAASAVASYLAAFYDKPAIKRVSSAERQRFAEQPLEARKDVGATGKQAVIEITNERYIRERRSGQGTGKST
jgi:hypothetical protein